MKRRCLLVGLTLTLAAGGCQNLFNSSKPSDATTSATRSAEHGVSFADAGPTTNPAKTPGNARDVPPPAQLLEQKVMEGAQRLEPLMQKRHDLEPGVEPGDRSAAAPAPEQRPQISQRIEPANAPPATQQVPPPPAPAMAPGWTANQASYVVAPPAIARSPLDSLEQKVHQRATENPRDLAAQIDDQLLMFVQNRPVPQLEGLSSLAAEDQEILSATLDALSNLRNLLRSDSGALESRKVRPLLDLADRLRAEGELTIPTLALCSRVDGFGVYEPMDAGHFKAGREQQAILYCEIDNFASKQDEKRLWTTRLQEQITLYTESGVRAWGEDKPRETRDESRNKRRDFFLVKMVTLPATLAPGRYILKVTIVDEQAQRIAEGTLPVQVGGQ